jgi:hypothetical protein
MTLCVLIERYSQEMIRLTSILIFFTVSLFVYTILAYLSERSHEKEIEKRKYKRNLLLSMTAQTKVDLELKELTTR